MSQTRTAAPKLLWLATAFLAAGTAGAAAVGYVYEYLADDPPVPLCGKAGDRDCTTWADLLISSKAQACLARKGAIAIVDGAFVCWSQEGFGGTVRSVSAKPSQAQINTAEGCAVHNQSYAGGDMITRSCVATPKELIEAIHVRRLTQVLRP